VEHVIKSKRGSMSQAKEVTKMLGVVGQVYCMPAHEEKELDATLLIDIVELLVKKGFGSAGRFEIREVWEKCNDSAMTKARTIEPVDYPGLTETGEG